MKYDHMHREFVRQHFSLLTSMDYDRRAYKDAMNGFYVVKHRKKFSFPTHREVMETLVALLRATTSDDAIHQMINTLPIFKEAGERECERIRELLNKKEVKSVLSEEQLQAVKEVGAFEAVARYKGKEIEDQKQKELIEIQKQINQKRDEYESIPSILDHEAVEEPDFNPKVEDIKPWWERFYLRSDPFPRKDGLSAIDKDLYEAVIIKTEPFQTTLSNLQRNSNYLFNTGFLLAGDYGYGKTTFVDYLSNYLINRDILPLRITSSKSYVDASGFADSFLSKLRTDLKEEARKMTALDERELQGLQLEDQVVELCSRVLSARRKGIVIFMDDYHKFRSHFPQIFEFLGTLQILKDTLTRDGLNVGFVVSGIPSWLDELQRNSQLVGFLDHTPIRLPDVSPELICDVFNRRIDAFCYESTPRRIKPDFVRKLVKDLGGEQGIRGCINKIVDELSNNNLAIVDSPVELASEVLEEIRTTLESDSGVKASINKLLFESRFKRYSNEQIARCLELVVHLNVQGGISEEDRQFIENTFHFQVLRETGLIQKQKSQGGTPFKWNLSHKFAMAVQTVSKKYNLNLTDYLLKLYAYKDYVERRSESDGRTADPILNVKRFFGRRDIKLDKMVRESIDEGLQRLESLLLREPGPTPDAGMLNTGLDALEKLTTGMCGLDSSHAIFARVGIMDTKSRWLLRPGVSELIQEALQRIHDYEKVKTPQTLSHALKLLTDALVEIAQKLGSIGEQLCEATEPLLHRPAGHTTEETELLQTITNGFYSTVREDHFDYVRNLTDYLELRFRKYFYFSGSLVFGAKYFDYCPKAILGYAHKNLETRTSFSPVSNKFDGLTRSQFKFIFIEGNLLRDHAVRILEIPWKDEDWKTFAGIFAVENIKTAHQQVDAYAAQDKLRYRKYANLAEELMAAINQCAANTVNRYCYIVAPATNATPIDCRFRFVFKAVATDQKETSQARVFDAWPTSAQLKDPVIEHQISAEAYDRVSESLRSKLESESGQIVTQDLLDIEYIETHYRVTLAEFICTLSYLKHVSKEFLIEPWFGSSVAIKKRK